MDCSPPGSSVHGILQARIPERVAISSSRGSSRRKDWTRVSCLRLLHWQADSLPLEPPGKPWAVTGPLKPYLSVDSLFISWGQKTFAIKGEIVNISGFVRWLQLKLHNTVRAAWKSHRQYLNEWDFFCYLVAKLCPIVCDPIRLLSPWNFPGRNTGVGCPFLLRGIFPTPGSNLHPLHQQADSLPLSHQESPK